MLEGELMLFVDGVAHVLGPDRVVRVGPGVRRQLVNAGPARLVLLALGGAGEHVGRDGMAWASWDEEGPGRPPRTCPRPRTCRPAERAAQARSAWAAPSAAGTLAIACSMSSSEMSRCVTARRTPVRTVGESCTSASRSRRSSASERAQPERSDVDLDEVGLRRARGRPEGRRRTTRERGAVRARGRRRVARRCARGRRARTRRRSRPGAWRRRSGASRCARGPSARVSRRSPRRAARRGPWRSTASPCRRARRSARRGGRSRPPRSRGARRRGAARVPAPSRRRRPPRAPRAARPCRPRSCACSRARGSRRLASAADRARGSRRGPARVSSRPSFPGSPRVWSPACVAAPPSSEIMMWALSSTISSVPRTPRITSAISLAIVALGRYTASGWPTNAAAASSSALTVGSSRFCSSPTAAATIASRIAGDGIVWVSERRSIIAAPAAYGFPHRARGPGCAGVWASARPVRRAPRRGAARAHQVLPTPSPPCCAGSAGGSSD